ncbi:TIGR02206 family membrane protein [Ornithinimicrobium pratense]|nr:TIGR02206 family membrane protein [Ornithinimicrobium pratense]
MGDVSAPGGRHTCPVQHFFRHEVDPLVIGGPDHRTYLAFYLTLLVLLVSARDLARRREELVRRTLVLVSVAQQLVMYGVHLARGDRWAAALPLHVCRLCTLLGLVWLLTGEDWAMQVAFYLGLFAYGSLAYPYGIEPRDHVMGWSFVVNHSLTLLLPVYAGVVHGWRPHLRGLGWSYLAFLGYLAVADRTNRRTGGNYFYLQDRPVLRSLSHRRYLATAAAGAAGLFGAGYAVSRLWVRESSR